jgi:hypothetical protein
MKSSDFPNESFRIPYNRNNEKDERQQHRLNGVTAPKIARKYNFNMFLNEICQTQNVVF